MAYPCLRLVWLVVATFVLAGFCDITTAQLTQPNETFRPNILWVTSEDNGPQLGCYGDTYADTPFLDGLAERSVIYENCWSNAPVCAPARTTLISGVFPTSLGGQHMRSQVALPSIARLYPQLFREVGYYCTNNSKEDYNLEIPQKLWDASSSQAHWRNRKPGQPFFAVFNFTISHESKIRDRPHTPIHDPAEVVVPPYHPDTPEVRRDWAQYYDRLTQMDLEVGRVLAQLQEDGLENNTIVFYYGDHGSGMPRSKRWLYQSGLHVPLIIHVPERLRDLAGAQRAGTKSDRLVSFVDFMPSVLSLASIEPPEYLQGKAFLGKYATPNPDYIYGFRDRMDERYDMSRAVRDERYLYIRNFYPQRPQGTYLDYMFQTPTTQVWKKMFDEGSLNAAQSMFWLPKPPEELYDIQVDPYQVNNLVSSSAHGEALERMRAEAKRWMLEIRDVGFMPEGEMLENSVDSPYDLAHDAERYPLEAIYDIADLASRPTPGDLDAVLAHRVAPNSDSRFWVANGLLFRAVIDQDRDAAVAAARGMTTDTSPYVRCIANETIARFGKSSERALAIKALTQAANIRNGNVFVAMTALNSLDWCAPTREEIGDSLVGLPTKSPDLPGRYDSFMPKLLERVNSILK